jgi:hypothetical protein
MDSETTCTDEAVVVAMVVSDCVLDTSNTKTILHNNNTTQQNKTQHNTTQHNKTKQNTTQNIKTLQTTHSTTHRNTEEQKQKHTSKKFTEIRQHRHTNANPNRTQLRASCLGGRYHSAGGCLKGSGRTLR